MAGEFWEGKKYGAHAKLKIFCALQRFSHVAEKMRFATLYMCCEIEITNVSFTYTKNNEALQRLLFVRCN